jgi:hypothetical protein
MTDSEVENFLRKEFKRLNLECSHQWMHCEDKMPPINEKVIFVDKKDGQQIGRYMHAKGDGGEFKFWFTQSSIPFAIENVTHWTPLLELPED